MHQARTSTDLIEVLIFSLEQDGTESPKLKPHLLKDNCKGLWEVNIQPFCLLIWQQDDEIKSFLLTRTGTHSDLF